MSCQWEVQSKRCHVNAREMLCFTLKGKMTQEMLYFIYNKNGCGRLGRGGVKRRLRLCSPMVGSVCHWEVWLQVAKRIVMVGSRRRPVADGGALLLGNAIAGFYGGAVLVGNQMQVSMAALCCWGMPVEVAKRVEMVGSRWRWVADGCTLSLGNAIAGLDGAAMAGFHGVAVLLVNASVAKRIVMVGSRWHWDGGGCALLLGNARRGVVGERNCRFPWGGCVIGEFQCRLPNAL